jgi:hypothetical protein
LKAALSIGSLQLHRVVAGFQAAFVVAELVAANGLPLLRLLYCGHPMLFGY